MKVSWKIPNSFVGHLFSNLQISKWIQKLIQIKISKTKNKTLCILKGLHILSNHHTNYAWILIYEIVAFRIAKVFHSSNLVSSSAKIIFVMFFLANVWSCHSYVYSFLQKLEFFTRQAPLPYLLHNNRTFVNIKKRNSIERTMENVDVFPSSPSMVFTSIGRQWRMHSYSTMVVIIIFTLLWLK